ncbi:MAG: DUF4147 domain-containing protein [Methylovulum sp.]|nr:DUF4147 domain-containing protein [Methylovulum sp.]
MATLLELRRQTLQIFEAGIAAANPSDAVKRYLKANDDQLEILLDDGSTRTGHWSKIHLIAFGKAACAMTAAAQQIIPAPLLSATPIAVTNYENVTSIIGVDVIGAGHPLPDNAGLMASKQIIDQISHTQKDELVLVLVSGGGSALIPYPANGISLQEKIATTDLLLACGATINEINCVRKHLSQLKGGGLARLALPADVHALILSDVLGDDLSAVASGPTVPDNSTYADAVTLLKMKGIWDKIPVNVQSYLDQGRLGKRPETPKPNDDVFIKAANTLIGSNAISVTAMLKTAQKLGYETQLYSGHLCGEAREEAEKLAVYAKKINKPLALLAGGETTVTLHGDGLGGRNQEMALAFALAAGQHGLTGQWVFLSGGTDGRDGPTDAAGGLVDPNTLTRMITTGCDAIALLANNDSYHALKNSQDLLDTGATGTNVADLQVLLIHPNLGQNPF